MIEKCRYSGNGDKQKKPLVLFTRQVIENNVFSYISVKGLRA